MLTTLDTESVSSQFCKGNVLSSLVRSTAFLSDSSGDSFRRFSEKTKFLWHLRCGSGEWVITRWCTAARSSFEPTTDGSGFLEDCTFDCGLWLASFCEESEFWPLLWGLDSSSVPSALSCWVGIGERVLSTSLSEPLRLNRSELSSILLNISAWLPSLAVKYEEDACGVGWLCSSFKLFVLPPFSGIILWEASPALAALIAFICGIGDREPCCSKTFGLLIVLLTSVLSSCCDTWWSWPKTQDFSLLLSGLSEFISV